MVLDVVNGIPVVRLRAFRAINEPETCQKFIEGHKHVLANFGIEMITSAKNDWIENPGVIVLVVESLNGEQVFGGLRLQFANGLFLLPIETAVGYMDKNIHVLVDEKAKDITAESCGLWNSRLIAGYGIGSIFLSRAGASLASVLGAKSVFSLCAPYTVQLAEDMGMRIVKSLGQDGTFYYPKLDLVATVLVNEYMEDFRLAAESCKVPIMDLIDNPNKTRIEKLRNKEIEIHYSLTIPGINPSNMKDAILGKI